MIAYNVQWGHLPIFDQIGKLYEISNIYTMFQKHHSFTKIETETDFEAQYFSISSFCAALHYWGFSLTTNFL